MTNFSKPGNCECGAAVSFYGKKSRGWDCGHRERWDGMNWVKWAACPIPTELTAAQKEVKELKRTNISLRNTISALTEQLAEYETIAKENKRLFDEMNKGIED